MNEQVELRDPTGVDAILDNAGRLQSYIGSSANEIEEARCITPGVLHKLSDAGVFRMNMPREWGGPELTSVEQVTIIEALSSGDASVGWFAMSGCDSGIFAGYLDDQIARDLYPHLDVVQSGSIFPTGIAEEVDGGYKVSGHWHFCSGASHADMIGVGCLIYRHGEQLLDDNGNPVWRMVLAPASHWQVDQSLDTTGLRGAASHDCTTLSKYLVIPREHTFSFFDLPHRQEPLWAGRETILRKMAGVPLGTARGALDHVKEVLRTEKGERQIKTIVADAEMILGSARAYVYKALDRQWHQLAEGKNLSAQERADVWLSRLAAFQGARDVCRLLYDAMGTDSMTRGVIDRAMRDTHTMCQHVVGHRRSLREVGGLLLDPDASTPMQML